MSEPTTTTPYATVSEARQWAADNNLEVGTRGRLSEDVVRAYNGAHPNRPLAPKE